MAEADKRSRRYLDELDRQSPVSLSGATRARDVSRPSSADIERALERLATPPSTAAEEAPQKPHNG